MIFIFAIFKSTRIDTEAFGRTHLHAKIHFRERENTFPYAQNTHKKESTTPEGHRIWKNAPPKK
jgi:hypothetical protein